MIIRCRFVVLVLDVVLVVVLIVVVVVDDVRRVGAVVRVRVESRVRGHGGGRARS
jgi:hypothetical protein